MTEEAKSPSPKKIIVANQLPLRAQQDESSGKWRFSLDEDSILVQLKDGFSDSDDVYYVGCLKDYVDQSLQEEVATTLLRDFKCVPTFLDSDLYDGYYHGFCKQQLWPLFHYMLPLCESHSYRFDPTLWKAYVTVNREFAKKIAEILSDDSNVWIHDYHLMVVPTFLRKSYRPVKIGFFLHSPFPSSEIYRALPVRHEILRSLLNSDLIGFHTYDYARHFLSCCSRILGLSYQAKRGYLSLDYYGRTIGIKIRAVGVHMGQLESLLDLPETSFKVKELKERFHGKTLILGVDDTDIFKGISLKMWAMKQLLDKNPHQRGKMILVQIANPARSSGIDVEATRKEMLAAAKCINDLYGFEGYDPIVLVDSFIPLYEKISYYVIADCCVVTPLRDGMNLVPYKYVVCRQGTEKLAAALGIPLETNKSSPIVLSEFIGCSPSLSGAIRVNPWNIDSVVSAILDAINLSVDEQRFRHEKHYKYVSSHNVGHWAFSFDEELGRVCRDNSHKNLETMGFGTDYRFLALSPNFSKLCSGDVVQKYQRTNRRAIFLDCDGTIRPYSLEILSNNLSEEMKSILNILCSDVKNTVLIVSGRGRQYLEDLFSSCSLLGIAAEHGFFTRWNQDSVWEVISMHPCSDWKDIVRPILRHYTETTDGSSIEEKETAMVWHYQNTDHDFGSCQAKELVDHLEGVLMSEPMRVKRDRFIVEVMPQGVSKGLIVKQTISKITLEGGPLDFVLCIGDDQSDEDMFETLSSGALPSAEVFLCTVGQKPTRAEYYLDDTQQVTQLLEHLATASLESSSRGPAGSLQGTTGTLARGTKIMECDNIVEENTVEERHQLN